VLSGNFEAVNRAKTVNTMAKEREKKSIRGQNSKTKILQSPNEKGHKDKQRWQNLQDKNYNVHKWHV
jgi:hypothetical protein